MLWVGSLALIVSLIVICAALCPSDSYRSEFPMTADCIFTSHVFVQAGIGLSFLLIVPLIGIFLDINRSIILDGFYMSPFKPPRFRA